jgi:hypothetical protein
LIIGVRSQPKRVPVSLFPGDVLAHRLGGDEQLFALLGVIGNRHADVGEVGAGQELHVELGRQFLGDGHGLAGLGAVVSEDHLERTTEDAAGGIDFLDRHDPAIPVRPREVRLRGVAVEFPNADRFGGTGHARRRDSDCDRCHAQHSFFATHFAPPTSWLRLRLTARGFSATGVLERVGARSVRKRERRPRSAGSEDE